MSRIGFIDIGAEPNIYIFEKHAGNFEIKDTKHFLCTKEYDISLPETIGSADDFYLSLPLSALDFRVMELPFSDKSKIMSILPFELEGVLLAETKDIILDAVILGGTEGKSRVLAVFVRKNILKKIIESFNKLNIDPRVITSMEINKLAADFHPDKLFNPPVMSKEERITAAIGEMKSSAINLRQKEFSYTKDTERTARSLRLTAILGVAAVFLFAAVISLKLVSVRAETAGIENEIRGIFSKVFPGEKNKAAGLYNFKSKIKELRDKEGYLVGISPLSLLLDLSGIDRGNVAFSEISMDKERITLRGEASSFSDAQKIKDALSNILSDVNISDSRTSVQGKVLFTVTAKAKVK